MVKIKTIILMLLFVLSSHLSFAESKYENWIKDFTKRYPIPLGKNETVFDWWPLRNNLEYKYKIAYSKWDFGKKWVNKEFTLKLIQDKVNKNKFKFNITGFDEFPYKGLVIRENRIFIITGSDSTRNPSEAPFIIFPLFKDMFFANEKYEYDFLKKVILISSEKMIYAPVWTEFWTVTKIVGNKYFLSQACPRGLHYTFEKNLGIVEWFVPGGYLIKLIGP